MASSLLISARHGAYLAIALYVAMVLIVSLSPPPPVADTVSTHTAFPSGQVVHKTPAGHVDLAAHEPDIAG